MKKITLFPIIIILVILVTGFFLFIKHQQEEAGLKNFYKLTQGDPLFYSSFFDSKSWEKAIKTLRESEDEYKKSSIKIFPKVLPHATINEKNNYISTLQGLNLFPYQLLKDLILINQKTQEFLKNPSTKLGRELLGLYDDATASYIQNISSKIKILEDYQSSHKMASPAYFSFIDNNSNSDVIENDFLTVKENGNKLKEEVAKRKKCLLGNGPCVVSPQDNKKIDTFADSFNAKFDLKGENVDFIKSTLHLSDPHVKGILKGPYKIKSFCWQSPDFEHWMYLIYWSPENGETSAIPKLATQNYYIKIVASSGISNKINNALLKNGFIFYNQNEATTYSCTDLTFYPELLTLDFLKEKTKSGKITKEDLKKNLVYKLLVENQFGLIAPAIISVSDQLKMLKLTSLIDSSGLMPESLVLTRSAYSIFYFPFAKSIWRIDKKLQYFASQDKNPLMHAEFITLDELEKLGYTKTEIEKFHYYVSAEKFYKFLFPEIEF